MSFRFWSTGFHLRGREPYQRGSPRIAGVYAFPNVEVSWHNSQMQSNDQINTPASQIPASQTQTSHTQASQTQASRGQARCTSSPWDAVSDTSDSPVIELLSPAGDWDCAQAAIENGADAIYFGLDCGFNARHRAKNFGLSDLNELSAMLRKRGVRGYATLNTLVFPSEMPAMVDTICQIAQSGIDAVLVQDFGVARLVREVCPDLEIHASTQMSLTSSETIATAAGLGLSRVVLARELSVAEISKIASATTMPLEVFIHGALCVAYSGQCLTSESLGGRSANRGQCAQACRLPYELICDGEDRPLDDVRYLLSPQDLAGYEAIPALIDAGVASIKIEGRLKTPEYVANITGQYRRAIDHALAHGKVNVTAEDQQEMELSFSRGFSPGWLEGNDHKRLVPGLHSAKRGILLGEILDVRSDQIQIQLKAPVQLGDGLAIHCGDEEATEGGRIYSLSAGKKSKLSAAGVGDSVWVGFGRGEINWHTINIGDEVFKNDDPQLNRKLRKSYDSADPRRLQPIDMQVIAVVGQPMLLTGTVAGGQSVTVQSSDRLQQARNRPLDEAVLREKLGRLGGTAFQLGKLSVELDSGPMVPMKMMNDLRRQLVDQLNKQLATPPKRLVDRAAGIRLLAPCVIVTQQDPTQQDSTQRNSTADQDKTCDPSADQVKLAVLCRTTAQTEAACRAKVDWIYLDYHDIRTYRDGVAICRDHAIPVALSTVRMQKPGEMGLCKVLLRHQPDAILARNLAALSYFQSEGLPIIADFSLNVSNHRSAEWLLGLGSNRITASYDLNRDQLFDLVESVPASWVEVVMHQHMPMFHMEHCVFCSVLSPGTNKHNCGRPCDDHVVQLRDRVGAEHTLQADVACRNTLYNASAQSGAEIVGDLISKGCRWFRIELLEEDAVRTNENLALYQSLLAGQVEGREVWEKLNASNRVGVTRGTLESKRNPLAII